MAKYTQDELVAQMAEFIGEYTTAHSINFDIDYEKEEATIQWIEIPEELARQLIEKFNLVQLDEEGKLSKQINVDSVCNWLKSHYRKPDLSLEIIYNDHPIGGGIKKDFKFKFNPDLEELQRLIVSDFCIALRKGELL